MFMWMHRTLQNFDTPNNNNNGNNNNNNSFEIIIMIYTYYYNLLLKSILSGQIYQNFITMILGSSNQKLKLLLEIKSLNNWIANLVGYANLTFLIMASELLL